MPDNTFNPMANTTDPNDPWNGPYGNWQPSQEQLNAWGPAYYQKWTSSDPDYDPQADAQILANMRQSWYRSPNWAGGIVYNPYYGWQDRSAVKQQYQSATGPVTWEQFQGWGLPQNTANDWNYYFPNGAGGGGSGMGTSGNDRQGIGQFIAPETTREGVFAPGTTGSFDDPAGAFTGVQYPQEMLDASGILSALATTGGTRWNPDALLRANSVADVGSQTGYETSTPNPWNAMYAPLQNMMNSGAGVSSSGNLTGAASIASDVGQTGGKTADPLEWLIASLGLTDMAGQGGKATTSDPWYAAQQQTARTNISDEIAQAAEQAGLTGTRWSSEMGRQAQDITGRHLTELEAQYAQMEQAAQEAARAREMDAYSQLFGVGQGRAGLSEAAAGRKLEAGGLLSNIGQTEIGAQEQMKARAQEALNQMFQLGQGEVNQEEAAAQRQLQYTDLQRQLANDEYAIQNDADNRQLQAAQLLGGLGQNMWDMESDAISQMAGIGTQVQASQQGQANTYLQQYMRLMEENNPWLSVLMNAAQLPSQMTQTTYNPGAGTQGLTALFSLLPLLGL
jgi:hypothetical protein